MAKVLIACEYSGTVRDAFIALEIEVNNLQRHSPSNGATMGQQWLIS